MQKEYKNLQTQFNWEKTICSRRYAFWKYSCRQRGLVFTDFDECGFGYKEFDIGVPRLHLIASGQLEEAWGNFMMGYGENISESAIRLGAASRIFIWQENTIKT